mmetsp:Transcript_4434/g.6545  ORF Transcript_4434/g.6545 Transcript_4434/m.6545 type:complete len:163 (-) Transcript_4434:1575-2063(-)
MGSKKKRSSKIQEDPVQDKPEEDKPVEQQIEEAVTKPPPAIIEEPIPEEETAEMKDSLLEDFSKEQKEYIVKEIYPLLKQSLLHFMNKSMDTEYWKLQQHAKNAKVMTKEEIDQKIELSSQGSSAFKQKPAFGGFSMTSPAKTSFGGGFSMGGAPKPAQAPA